MKMYNITCPVCGTVNHNLFLEETGGWMECEHCGQMVNALLPEFQKKIPLYTGKQLTQLLASNTVGTR